MSNKSFKNPYDDENTPRIDLPPNNTSSSAKTGNNVEPLPESARPRKDGPGGE